MGDEELERAVEWAHGLVARRAYAYGAATQRVLRAKVLHGPGEYVSPVNGRPVQAAVLEFDDGTTTVVRWPGLEGSFVELTAMEYGAYRAMQAGVAASTMEVANHAKRVADSVGSQPAAILLLLAAALREQARQVDLARDAMVRRDAEEAQKAAEPIEEEGDEKRFSSVVVECAGCGVALENAGYSHMGESAQCAKCYRARWPLEALKSIEEKSDGG